jgi:cytochrome oxidase Cu insertion factor (SCO1/SenC/PrrC family)
MKNTSSNLRIAFTVLIFWLLMTMAWWAFAFMRLPTAFPVWMIEVRTVCFGILPSGLPDTWGFFKLMAPLPMLAALLVLWWREMKQLPGVIQKSGSLIFLVSLLAVAAVVEGGWVTCRIHEGLALQRGLALDEGGEDFPVTYPRTDRAAESFTLVNQHGDAVSLQDFGQRPVILTFAFAHCQTICPMLVATAKKVIAEIPTLKPQLLIVTLDPWRDTPSSLPSIAKAWGLPEEAFLLSGKIDDVSKVLDDYQITRQKNEGNGDIVHAGIFYVIRAGQIVYTLNAPSSAALIAAVRRSQKRPNS